MTESLMVVLSFVPCVGCVVAAGSMAMTGHPNWGWFILAAVVLSPSIRVKS